MLITLAGVGLSGTPDTGRPAAHSMASAMSEDMPPHLPSARTGWIRAFQSMPARSRPLLVAAPTTLATPVPCHDELATVQVLNRVSSLSALVSQSPGSLASASRPSPSLETAGSVMKS